jgi:hypothetical protein
MTREYDSINFRYEIKHPTAHCHVSHSIQAEAHIIMIEIFRHDDVIWLRITCSYIVSYSQAILKLETSNFVKYMQAAEV